MRIEPPLEKVSQRNPLPPFTLLLLALAAGIILYAFFSRSHAPNLDFTVLEATNAKAYDSGKKLWVGLKSGDSLEAGTVIQSWPGGNARLRSGQSILSMEESTILKTVRHSYFSKNRPVAVVLERGQLLVSAENQNLNIVIPGRSDWFAKFFPILNINFKNADVYFSTSPEYSHHVISVFEGSASAKGRFPGNRLELTKGNKIELKAPHMQFRAVPIEQTHELPAPPTATPLSLEGPSSSTPEPTPRLVYDLSRGVSFNTKSGESKQTLGVETTSGDQFTEIRYSVTQPSSLAGINFPTEEIEISRFSGLLIQLQKVPAQEFPEAFRIEFKSRDRVIRVFTGTLKTEESAWQAFTFPFKFSNSLKISEISLIFSNGKVGEAKQGSVRLKKLSLF